MDSESAALIARLYAEDAGLWEESDTTNIEDYGVGQSYADYEEPMSSYERQIVDPSVHEQTVDGWGLDENPAAIGEAGGSSVQPGGRWSPTPADCDRWEDGCEEATDVDASYSNNAGEASATSPLGEDKIPSPTSHDIVPLDHESAIKTEGHLPTSPVETSTKSNNIDAQNAKACFQVNEDVQRGLQQARRIPWIMDEQGFSESSSSLGHIRNSGVVGDGLESEDKTGSVGPSMTKQDKGKGKAIVSDGEGDEQSGVRIAGPKNKTRYKSNKDSIIARSSPMIGSRGRRSAQRKVEAEILSRWKQGSGNNSDCEDGSDAFDYDIKYDYDFDTGERFIEIPCPFCRLQENRSRQRQGQHRAVRASDRYMARYRDFLTEAGLDVSEANAQTRAENTLDRESLKVTEIILGEKEGDEIQVVEKVAGRRMNEDLEGSWSGRWTSRSNTAATWKRVHAQGGAQSDLSTVRTKGKKPQRGVDRQKVTTTDQSPVPALPIDSQGDSIKEVPPPAFHLFNYGIQNTSSSVDGDRGDKGHNKDCVSERPATPTSVDTSISKKHNSCSPHSLNPAKASTCSNALQSSNDLSPSNDACSSTSAGTQDER